MLKTGIDHFHPGVPQRSGNDLCAAVVTVESYFGNQNADGSVHGAKISLRGLRGLKSLRGLTFKRFNVKGFKV
jgi:hypothetical protein